MSSVREDSVAGAEGSQPVAGGVEARGHHQGVAEAALTEVVAVPPQGGGVPAAPLGEVGEAAPCSAPGSARGSGQAVAPVLGGSGSGEEEAPADPCEEGGAPAAAMAWALGRR